MIKKSFINSSKPKCIWRIKSTLGEGTLWVPSLNSLFFVDIKKKKIKSKTVSELASAMSLIKNKDKNRNN